MSAEAAWQTLREKAPVSEPQFILCEDGIRRWILPPGAARGCEMTREFANFKSDARYRGPFELWAQEQFVYRQEMSSAVRRALAVLRWPAFLAESILEKAHL